MANLGLGVLALGHIFKLFHVHICRIIFPLASPVVNLVAAFVNLEHMRTCGCMNIFVRNGQQIERGGNLDRNSIIPILSSLSRNFLPR